jgi:hypothetical protein
MKGPDVASPARNLMVERNEAIFRLGHWTASFTALVGPDVLKELANFARTAGAGSMLTIRCTRDGFTAQTTGPIVGGRVATTPDEVIELAAEIE